MIYFNKKKGGAYNMAIVDRITERITNRKELKRLYDKLSELDPLSNEYEKILRQIVNLSRES